MNVTYKRYADYLNNLKHAGKLWYIVGPQESTFQFPEEVPDYYQQIWLPFFILIILENFILLARNNSFRLNDHVCSLSHWIFQESGRIFFRGAEYWTYIWIHEKYQLWCLPWDSLWTWCIAIIGVDFCYYWVHRANHEVHFLWAQHQVHHSSEEFNLVVGLRQSVLQHWCSFIFYLPLALFVPPSHFIAHNQFNLIYQLWIHTTVIKDLGPFELVFNTPKHHRVHHGCNLYCLDKNYGGVLIIWDRLFKTFEEERSTEKIIYGLVVSPQSFNPLYLQIFYTKAMIERSLSMKTFSDKLSVIWKGPSWLPGLPRLGLDEFKVNVTTRVKYDRIIQKWESLYVLLHFFIVLYLHFQMYNVEKDFVNFSSVTLMINNLFALTTIGLLFDKYKYWHILELLRCSLYLLIMRNNSVTNFYNTYIVYSYLLSCFILIYQISRYWSQVSSKVK